MNHTLYVTFPEGYKLREASMQTAAIGGLIGMWSPEDQQKMVDYSVIPRSTGTDNPLFLGTIEFTGDPLSDSHLKFLKHRMQINWQASKLILSSTSPD